MPQRTFLQNRWNFSHFHKFSNTKAQKMQTGPLRQAIKYDCNNKSKENKSKKQFSSGSQNWLLLCNKYVLNTSPAELGGRKANLVTDMQSYEQLEVKKLGIFRQACSLFFLSSLFSGMGEKKTPSSSFPFQCNIHLTVLLFKYQKERCRVTDLPPSITGLLMPACHSLWNSVRGRNQDPNILFLITPDYEPSSYISA